MRIDRRLRVHLPILALLVVACGGGSTTGIPSAGAATRGATASPPARGPATHIPGPTTSPAPPPTVAPTTPPPSSTPAAGPSDPTRARIALEQVAQGLDSPLFAAGAGDGSDRLFVVERGGRIRILGPGGLLDPPFLSISDRITAGGEQGLLGLAFHPDFAANGRFFVNYTDRNGDTVVSEFGVSTTDADVADADTERLLIRIDQPYANHNGGMVAFGPDGYLYVGMGDGGSAGDPQNRSQDLGSLLGKMLRIDVDVRSGSRPYGIPADNPFGDGTGGRPEIWSFGLRNPWRFSFDRADGTMWIGDVGQGAWEEVDREPRGTGGLNYGWRIMEGAHCYRTSGCDEAGLTLPVAEYSHEEGCSITGGYAYRGSGVPALVGAYLFSDYCSGTIWAIDAAEPGPQVPRVLLESGLSISSFGQDDSGELYVTDISGGTVSRIVATP